MLNTDISGRWTRTDFGDISTLILMVSILSDIVESVTGLAPVRTFREYLHNNNNRLLGLCMSLLISKKLRGAATIFRYDDEPLSAAQRFFFFRQHSRSHKVGIVMEEVMRLE